MIAAGAGRLWQVRGRSGGPAQPQVIPVTSLPGTESQPYFSPDGKKIVYVWSGENGENSDLYVQSLDDGAVRRITTDPADDLSPCGRRTARGSPGCEPGAAKPRSSWRMWPAGLHGKVADVYPIRLEAVGRHLDWSPDGEYLAAAGQIAARRAVPHRPDSGQGRRQDRRDPAARQDHRRHEPGVLARRKVARLPARGLQRRGRRVRGAGAGRSGAPPHVR